jgi:hypothetical protein
MNKDYELVKVSTYAKEKGISVQAVYKQIEKGQLESVKLDNVRFCVIKRKVNGNF